MVAAITYALTNLYIYDVPQKSQRTSYSKCLPSHTCTQVAADIQAAVCRCLLALCLTEPAGLVKLGRSLHEQSGVYYLDESRRVLSMHAERRAPSPEINARTSFKVSYSDYVILCAYYHVVPGVTRSHRMLCCTKDQATSCYSFST